MSHSRNNLLSICTKYCFCSLAQISECGSDQVVDSIGSVSDDISDSDCSDSESCASGQQQPTSIDVSVVDPVDDRKSPTGQRIAKDTGCCLYSAITALVVMVVSCQTELDYSLSIYIFLKKENDDIKPQGVISASSNQFNCNRFYWASS